MRLQDTVKKLTQRLEPTALHAHLTEILASEGLAPEKRCQRELNLSRSRLSVRACSRVVPSPWQLRRRGAGLRKSWVKARLAASRHQRGTSGWSECMRTGSEGEGATWASM